MSSTAQAVPDTDPSLSWDDPTAYLDLLATLTLELQPATRLETALVEKMARHFLLAQRSLTLQEQSFPLTPADPPSRGLALYMRCQAHHDRAFFRYSAELRAHRNQIRKAEREFVSQKRLAEQHTARETARAEAETRRATQEHRAEAAEIRKIELHHARLRAIDAKTAATELDTDIRQTVEAPLPGHMRIPFDAMRDTFKHVVGEVSRQLASESVSATA